MKKWIILVMLLLVAMMVVIVSAGSVERMPDVSCEGGFNSEINGEFIDIFCYTPMPTGMATAVSPTRTATPTPTATDTVEPIITETAVLPTATYTAEPTHTATYIPTLIIDAGPVAVIGDSNSEPYEFIDRGGPDGYAWTEVLRDWRAVDFGDNDEFIVAHSGDRTIHLTRQIDEISQSIRNDQVGTVIIWMGWNDFRIVCNNIHDEPSLQSLEETIFNNLENSVTQLLELGMSAEHIHMVNQSSRTVDSDCGNVEQVNSIVADINVKLPEMASAHGINLINANVFSDVFMDYTIDDAGDISVDNVTIYHDYCDRQTCLYTADGHGNTVMNGLVANVLFVDVLGVTPLNDAELVKAAKLK